MVCFIVVAAVLATIVAVFVVTMTQQHRPDPPAWLSTRAVVTALTSEQVTQSTRKRLSAEDDDSQGSAAHFVPNESNSTSNIQWDSANETVHVSTVVVHTTTIVLSSSAAQVQILIVHGNMSVVEQNLVNSSTLNPSSAQRRKRNAASSGANLNYVPMLLVTADPYTGNITSFKATNNSSDPFKNAGLIVARSMLTNRDPKAYAPERSDFYHKRRASLVRDCAQLEHFGRNTYCPQFSKQTTANRTVYKKTYSTGSALFRSASNQIIDMNIQLETHISKDQKTLLQSEVTGLATLNAIKISGREPIQITLHKYVTTNFNQKQSLLSDSVVDLLNRLVSAAEFQEVDQKSNNSVHPGNLTAVGNITSNSSLITSLTRRRRNSDFKKSFRIATLFETGFDVEVGLHVLDNSATAKVGLTVGPFHTTVAEKNLGSDVAHAINQLLKVRKYVKVVLGDVKSLAAVVASALHLNILTSINNRITIIRSDVSNLKAAFLNPVTQIANQLKKYTNELIAIRNSVVTNIKRQIYATNNQLKQIQQQAQNAIDQKNQSISEQIEFYLQGYGSNSSSVLNNNDSAFVASLESELIDFILQTMNASQAQCAPYVNIVDSLKGELNAIANNRYSFAIDVQNASLTTIDNLFASFAQTEHDISEILKNITDEGNSIYSDLKTYVDNFKSSVTVASSIIAATLRNIAGHVNETSNTIINNSFDNIFDWDFMGDDITSIENSFANITYGINFISDQLSGQIQILVSDMLSVVTPSTWVQAYNSTMVEIAQLESMFNYRVNPPQRTLASVQDSASSIYVHSTRQLSSINVTDAATSVSSSNLRATIAQVLNVNTVLDSMINAFLGNQVVALYTIPLYTKSEHFPLAAIGTPIGLIGIGVDLHLNVNLRIGVLLTSRRFAAVLTPGLKVGLGADAFWSVEVIKVVATVGVEVDISATFSKQSPPKL